jgi:hypothetical protein
MKTVIDAIGESVPARRSASRAQAALARRSDVRQLRAATRSALAERRVARRAGAEELRRALHEHRAGVIAAVGRHARPGAPPLEDIVLAVIGNHPEGIGPRDIGNELGIDWRRLLATTRHLVETGAVDQIDHDLYPSGTARRTC